MQPTLVQRLFAGNWPLVFILAAGVVGAVGWCARTLVEDLRPTVPGIAWFCFLMVVAGLLGFFMAALAAAILLPPLYRWRSARNGAPYAVGDEVMILAAPHRGRVTRVCEVSREGDYVSVELGDEEPRDARRLFSCLEVCRHPTVEAV